MIRKRVWKQLLISFQQRNHRNPEKGAVVLKYNLVNNTSLTAFYFATHLKLSARDFSILKVPMSWNNHNFWIIFRLLCIVSAHRIMLMAQYKHERWGMPVLWIHCLQKNLKWIVLFQLWRLELKVRVVKMSEIKDSLISSFSSHQYCFSLFSIAPMKWKS